MAHTEAGKGLQSARSFDVDIRLLRAAAILVGVGGMIGFAGMVIGGSAVAAAARQWVRQLDQPPRQIARQKWQQAVAAGAAGVNAWRNGAPAANTLR